MTVWNAKCRVYVGVAAGVAALAGCAGSGSKAQANKPSDVNAGLNALAKGDQPSAEDLQKFMQQSALDMEELKKAQAERQRKMAEARLTQASLPEEKPEPAPVAVAPAEEPAPDAGAPSVGLNAQTKQADQSTQDRVRALAAELRKAINEKAGDPESAMPQYLALAMLEMLSARERGADSASLPALEKLSEKERAAVESVRELLESLARDPSAAGDPARVAALFAKSMEALNNAQSVRIARAELCSKVEAFGRFKPFDNAMFMAGQSNRLIVYTEVEKYGYRDLQSPGESGGNGDRWSVELSQELRLYNADGSMLAWRKPEESVTERSRNKRRDFFITQMIELPRTLTVGPYSLKVIIRDKVSGGVSEAVLPINIVADPALAAAPAEK